MAKESKKLIANNKKVYHDYFLEEKYETGIALAGTEVKSLRMGKCSIKEAFIRIENEEVIIYGMHVSPYEKGNIFNKDPLRPRKLLMHKQEIRKLIGKIKEKGYTLVPVEVYFSGSLVKVEIAFGNWFCDRHRWFLEVYYFWSTGIDSFDHDFSSLFCGI